MNTVKRAGVAVLVAAGFVLYVAVALFVFADSSSDVIRNSSYLLVDLLLVAGAAVGSRYIIKKARFCRIGKIALVAGVTILLFLFLFPTVERQNGWTCRGTDETCGPITSGNWAASTEWNSFTAHYLCWGGSYYYDSLDGLQFSMQMSCPPALAPPPDLQWRVIRTGLTVYYGTACIPLEVSHYSCPTVNMASHSPSLSNVSLIYYQGSYYYGVNFTSSLMGPPQSQPVTNDIWFTNSTVFCISPQQAGYIVCPTHP